MSEYEREIALNIYHNNVELHRLGLTEKEPIHPDDVVEEVDRTPTARIKKARVKNRSSPRLAHAPVAPTANAPLHLPRPPALSYDVPPSGYDSNDDFQPTPKTFRTETIPFCAKKIGAVFNGSVLAYLSFARGQDAVDLMVVFQRAISFPHDDEYYYYSSPVVW